MLLEITRSHLNLVVWLVLRSHIRKIKRDLTFFPWKINFFLNFRGNILRPNSRCWAHAPALLGKCIFHPLSKRFLCAVDGEHHRNIKLVKTQRATERRALVFNWHQQSSPTPKAQGVLKKGWKEFKSQRTRKSAVHRNFLIWQGSETRGFSTRPAKWQHHVDMPT